MACQFALGEKCEVTQIGIRSERKQRKGRRRDSGRAEVGKRKAISRGDVEGHM
jgi:hypothetical protein